MDALEIGVVVDAQAAHEVEETLFFAARTRISIGPCWSDLIRAEPERRFRELHGKLVCFDPCSPADVE
jgi:hypothetical protein